MWGRLGTTQWADIGVLDGFFRDAKVIGIGNIAPAAHADEDGNFEIIFSPDPQPGKVWVQIPRETRNVTLCFREAWEERAIRLIGVGVTHMQAEGSGNLDLFRPPEVDSR